MNISGYPVSPPEGTALVALVTALGFEGLELGLVFVPAVHPSRPLALRAVAFGISHLSGNRPSVYRIAHDRKHGKR